MSSANTGKKATYTIGVIPNTDIALFHWVGPISANDRVRNLHMMSGFCKEQGVSKLIIDGRDQQPQTGPIESFDFGTMVPSAFQGLNVAVVHRPDDETLKFIETVAFNRGSGTRAFVDIHRARSWLESF
jgi:hypothetical protein